MTPYAVAAIGPSSAVASGLAVGVGTVYKNAGRAEVVVEAAGRKVATVPVNHRSRLLLVLLLRALLPWVVQSRWAFPRRDEENLRLGRCA